MKKRKNKFKVSLDERGKEACIASCELLEVTPLCLAADSFPSQRCRSFSGHILKLLPRNVSIPAHKSDTS